MTEPLTDRPRIVIVGAGVSGLMLANLLRNVRAEVVVLDQAMSPARNRSFPGIVSGTDFRVTGLPPDLNDALPIGRIGRLDNVGVPTTHPVPDGWFAIEHGQLLDALKIAADANGVSIVPGATVTGFLWDDGVVAGVQCVDGPSYPADLVVLGDDASPRLAESLGLRPDWPPTELTHIGKRRYAANLETVRERLGPEGSGYQVLSITRSASWGSPGWGLVIPGRDSITVIVAMSLEEAMTSARHISEYLDEIETLPAVRDSIARLSLDAYVTEVVPTGGFDARHRFHADGVLVVSDLVGLTHPLNRDGLSTNLDVSAAAARSIDIAVANGNFRARSLRRYTAAIADDVIAPVNDARRVHKRLRTQPVGTWASKPELLNPAEGVTVGQKSATLSGMKGSGVLRRMRGLGRKIAASRLDE